MARRSCRRVRRASSFLIEAFPLCALNLNLNFNYYYYY
jgi:hypothetical protein